MTHRRFAYLIGANGPASCRLSYAEQDVERLAAVFRGERCQFIAVESIIAESRQQVLSGLKTFLDQCRSEDTVIVVFAGHGCLYGGDFYLVCNGTDLNDPVATAIECAAIKKYIEYCSARSKALILDCCWAGAAHQGIYRDVPDERAALQSLFHGCSHFILSACSHRERALELEHLDGGSGFLSWAIRAACTTHFACVSPDKMSLSLQDIWAWMPQALQEVKEVKEKHGIHELLPEPWLFGEQKGGNWEIWLTDPPKKERVARRDLSQARQRYLEHVKRLYENVRLPFGPDGLSLHALYQPLRLLPSSRSAEDLSRDERRFLPDEDEQVAKKQKELAVQHVVVAHIEEALEKSTSGRLIVLGGPGSGKTTTLKYLISVFAQKALEDSAAPLPLFISLSELARINLSISEYLNEMVKEYGIEREFAEVLWQAIEEGQACLCLDGLDEVKAQDRTRLIAWINHQSARQGGLWLVGSRFTEYKGGQFQQGRFAEWELQPLDENHQKELLRRLFPELERVFLVQRQSPPDIDTFLHQLAQDMQVTSWCENPLLLSLAAAVYVRSGSLPSNRAQLYQQAIEAVLACRNADPIIRELVLFRLEELALWVHQSRGRVFTLEELLLFFREVQGCSDTEVGQIARNLLQSGVVESVANKTYGFRHLTFQEYCAARALSRQLCSRDPRAREAGWQLLQEKRTYSRWSEVFKLLAVTLLQAHKKVGLAVIQRWLEDLLEQQETPEGDPGNLCLLQALQLLIELASFPAPLLPIGERVFQQWKQELWEAVEQRRTGKQDHLLAALQGGKRLPEAVRSAWTNSLQQLLQEPSIQNNVSSFLFVAHASLQLGAADQVFRVLLERYMDYFFSVSLIEIVKCVSFSLLEDAFFSTDKGKRSFVIPFLGERDDIPDTWIEMACNDEDGHVRRKVVEVIGHRVEVEKLLPLLKDEDGDVRAAVVEAVGARVEVERLLPLLKDEDGHVRRKVVEVIGHRVEVERLLPLLKDEDGDVRAAVVEAVGARVEVERLLPLLKDEYEDVRAAVVEAVGARVEVERLLPLLKDEDGDVRAAVVKAVGAKVEVETLLSLLEDEYADVRRAAVEEIEHHSAMLSDEALLALIGDEAGSVRKAALNVVRRHRPELLSEIYAEAHAILQHQPPGKIFRSLSSIVVAQMIGGLRLSGPASFAKLEEYLHWHHWQTRLAAVRALAKIRRHIPDHLVQLLLVLRRNDPSMPVRHAADDALADILTIEPMEDEWDEDSAPSDI
ncbi:NACHT domain-containing protein [Thermosporothrix hazakensis]|nr:NACHT domain-containing protein [Thermosporothrix hazakensis]GCE51370.1 hypothetical protein KTH_62390 [Thermosporothrix hazakensis]